MSKIKIQCFNCGSELMDEEEGYSSIVKCRKCGALNQVK